VDLAVVEVGDLGAEQVVLDLGIARREHVADHQHAAQRPVRHHDRRHRDARHPTSEGPDVLGGLAVQGGLDRRVLRLEVLAVHRVDVEIPGQHLPRGIEDRDDVGLAGAPGLEKRVQLLALLEGGLTARRLVRLVEGGDHPGPARQACHQIGELHRFETRHVAMHPLSPGDVAVDLLGHGVPQLAGDHDIDTRREGGENDGGD
jgi:hypothetical protein